LPLQAGTHQGPHTKAGLACVSPTMETAKLDALIELLRDHPDLCDQVLKAPNQVARAAVLEHLGFAVSGSEIPDRQLLSESLGLTD
jgi:hypothetical protein